MIRCAWFTPLTVAVFCACGGGGDDPPLTPNGYLIRGTTPYPERVVVGANPRNIVLRVETGVGGVATATRCGYSLVLFDATVASTQMPLATGESGDCSLYMDAPERDYIRQRWLCAGGINFESGSLMQVSGFCPQEGATPPWEGEFRTCGNLLTSRTATVSSGDETGSDDMLTDLTGTARFPTRPIITQPTNLTVTTWPAMGPLTVAWTTSDATSVVVRIAPDTEMRSGPVIVCKPRVNGSIFVDAALLDRGNFRASTSRISVWSYRETTVQAKGRAYNLVGAVGSSLLMQPGR
jgi:hypothetical protein